MLVSNRVDHVFEPAKHAGLVQSEQRYHLNECSLLTSWYSRWNCSFCATQLTITDNEPWLWINNIMRKVKLVWSYHVSYGIEACNCTILTWLHNLSNAAICHLAPCNVTKRVSLVQSGHHHHRNVNHSYSLWYLPHIIIAEFRVIVPFRCGDKISIRKITNIQQMHFRFRNTIHKMKSTVTYAGDFKRMLVPHLTSYLMDRCITCFIYRKAALVRLCQTAFNVELDVLTTPDDYKKKIWTNCAGLFSWGKHPLL